MTLGTKILLLFHLFGYEPDAETPALCCVLKTVQLEAKTQFFVENAASSVLATVSILLVGCKEDLNSLEEAEVEQFRVWLRRQTTWGPLALRKMATDQVRSSEQIRSKFVAELNKVLGRRTIEDVAIVLHDFLWEG